MHETGIRSPLDAAILQSAHPDVGEYRKLDEIPFDFERRRLSVVVQAGEAGTPLLITKGAPEPILQRCTAYEVDGDRREMDAGDRARCAATYENLSAQGYRVLAVAQRSTAPAGRVHGQR